MYKRGCFDKENMYSMLMFLIIVLFKQEQEIQLCIEVELLLLVHIEGSRHTS